MSPTRRKREDIQNDRPRVFNILFAKIKNSEEYDLSLDSIANDLTLYWQERPSSDLNAINSIAPSTIDNYCYRTQPRGIEAFISDCQAAVKPGPRSKKAEIPPVLWESLRVAVLAAEILADLEQLVEDIATSGQDIRQGHALQMTVANEQEHVKLLLGKLGVDFDDPTVQASIRRSGASRRRRR